MSTKVSPEELRARFPALGTRIYLNAASEGPMPFEAALEAARMARLKETPWDVGAEHYYQVPADVRARLETLFQAPPGTIGLVAGTSAGIGLAAQGLPLNAGDEVVLLEAQFPSNVFPWRAVIARGASVRVIRRPLGTDPTAALLGGLGASTRVVSVDWVNFVDGAVVDLEAVGSACRERGITFVVDAAQGAGALALDLGRLPVDMLAAPSHKWLLGPNGLGFVFVTSRLLPVIRAWNAGWVNLSARSGFRNLLRLDGLPPDDATRLETGTPPFALLSPWRASLDLLCEAGAGFAERRVLGLAGRLVEGIVEMIGSPSQGRSADRLGLISPAPPSPRSGIVSVTAGERTLLLYRALESKGVTVALREGAIRMSPHLYNTEEEIDVVLGLMRDFIS